MANREIFGQNKHDNNEQTEELEMAYQVEKLRADSASAGVRSLDGPELVDTTQGEKLDLFLLLNGVEVSGLLDKGDFLVVAPFGKGKEGRKVAETKVVYLGSKPEKIDIFGGDVHFIDLDPTRSLKVQIDFGANLRVNQKTSVLWSGAGKRLLIVDVRGRPLPDFGPGPKQQEMVRKMREKLF